MHAKDGEPQMYFTGFRRIQKKKFTCNNLPQFLSNYYEIGKRGTQEETSDVPIYEEISFTCNNNASAEVSDRIGSENNDYAVITEKESGSSPAYSSVTDCLAYESMTQCPAYGTVKTV